MINEIIYNKNNIFKNKIKYNIAKFVFFYHHLILYRMLIYS